MDRCIYLHKDEKSQAVEINSCMPSFKQFLIETATPTPENVDGKFTVGKVNFDNANGMGATGDNGNVAYMGCVIWMKPWDFREIATAADRGEDARQLSKHMLAGKPIGCPCVYVSSDGDGLKVQGHEGRARAEAFAKINGNDMLMPVHVFFRGGTRSRHIDLELLTKLKYKLIPEKGTAYKPIRIDRAFVNGKTIQIPDSDVS